MLLILIVLYRFRTRAFTQFWLIVVLCGTVEYLTSWILEIVHDGRRWWDYTGYYLNLNGRICVKKACWCSELEVWRSFMLRRL